MGGCQMKLQFFFFARLLSLNVLGLLKALLANCCY